MGFKFVALRLSDMRTFLCTLLSLVSLFAWGASNEEELQLAGSVHVIFDRKCNECHGSQLKKPEGKFGYVLDLKRVADNIEYVVRGKPQDSDLYRMLRDEEMPPDDHPKTSPLSSREKNIVRRWIAAGAPFELPATLPKLPVEDKVLPTAEQGGGNAKDLASKAFVTLDFKRRPAGEILGEIAKQSGIKVNYTQPEHEPLLSIQFKNGSVYDALNYLVLCGNLSLTFKSAEVIVGPNPPTEKKASK